MSPSYNFTGQVALVVGASSGMGCNPGQAAYHATTHGALGLTQPPRLQGPRGARISAACPGTIAAPAPASSSAAPSASTVATAPADATMNNPPTTTDETKGTR